MKPVRHLIRFTRFESRMRRALLRAALELLVIEVLLRSISLVRVCRLLGIEIGVTATVPELSSPTHVAGCETLLVELPTSDRRALLLVARRWPLGGACLRYSLALGWRLRRHCPTLVIGARRLTPSELDAHAWIELDRKRIDFFEPGAATSSCFVPLKAT